MLKYEVSFRLRAFGDAVRQRGHLQRADAESAVSVL